MNIVTTDDEKSIIKAIQNRCQSLLSHMALFAFKTVNGSEVTGCAWEKTGIQLQLKNKRKINIMLDVSIDDTYCKDKPTLPCPCCGKQPFITERKNSLVKIGCIACLLETTPFSYEGNAIDMWNESVSKIHARCKAGRLEKDVKS